MNTAKTAIDLLNLKQTADAMPILQWAKQFPPHWSDQAIAAWDENLMLEVMPFVTSHYWSDRHSINVFSVTGTAHPDYIGLTWRQFLEQGKRMPVNQNLLQANPAYYLDTGVKHPSMLYVSLDGKRWYVNGDGNHRTCLARFFFEKLTMFGFQSQTMIHGVHVDDYRVDWRLFDLYKRINTLLRSGTTRDGGRIECVREHAGREDGPAWKLDTYIPRIRYTRANGETALLDQEGARALLGRLTRQSSRKGLFGGVFG
jgi:hypothetical protein